MRQALDLSFLLPLPVNYAPGFIQQKKPGPGNNLPDSGFLVPWQIFLPVSKGPR
jgi:hypothetical protein